MGIKKYSEILMIVEFNKYYLDQITATEDQRLEEELASSFVK